jgi:hypothetical protein
MNWQVFVFGILTILSPAIAFFQDIGWRLGDIDDMWSRMLDWLASRTWEQRLLMRGMVLAGFMIMGAATLLGWKAWR